VFDPFHVKFLYAGAFRSPGVEQENSGTNIRPEMASNFEVETGYRINDNSIVQLNYFDVQIDRPIVYSVDPATDIESYQNFDDVGTRGVEMEYRFRNPLLYATLAYSFYRPSFTGVPLYLVPGHGDQFLGFPSHKITLNGHVKLVGGLGLNPSMIFTSQRYGYASQDADGNPVLKRFGPEVVLNVFLLYRNLFIKGLDAGVGVYDILGANHEFIQPYNGGHAPLPGIGREFISKLTYTWE
jgi:outer membrane receptor for ferrienterochelin and colicins